MVAHSKRKFQFSSCTCNPALFFYCSKKIIWANEISIRRWIIKNLKQIFSTKICETAKRFFYKIISVLFRLRLALYNIVIFLIYLFIYFILFYLFFIFFIIFFFFLGGGGGGGGGCLSKSGQVSLYIKYEHKQKLIYKKKGGGGKKQYYKYKHNTRTTV